jgi:hypothetical protein
MDIGLRLCLLVAGATLSVGSAFAQAATPETPTAPGPNLSKKLDQSNGVIHLKRWTQPSRSRCPKREIRTWCRRLQKIEGVVDEADAAFPVARGLSLRKARQALPVHAAKLAVEIRRFRPNFGQRGNHARIFVGPVEPRPGQQLRLPALNARGHAKAVQLDLSPGNEFRMPREGPGFRLIQRPIWGGKIRASRAHLALHRGSREDGGRCIPAFGWPA